MSGLNEGLLELEQEFARLATLEGNDPIRCSRMHFAEWSRIVCAARHALKNKPKDEVTDAVLAHRGIQTACIFIFIVLFAPPLVLFIDWYTKLWFGDLFK